MSKDEELWLVLNQKQYYEELKEEVPEWITLALEHFRELGLYP